jgi:hypothetical protein
MKTYYSHSLQLYNTEREQRELEYLRTLGDIENPNNGSKQSMTFFYSRIIRSDQVVCSEFQGHIGRGVYEELTIALVESIPSFVLRKRRIRGGFHLKQIKSLKIIDDTDWKIRFGKVKV